MAYNKTVYVNNTTPAISAENLNNSEEELKLLDTAVLFDNQYAASEWEKKGISFSNGTFTNSTTRANRIVDKNKTISIKCDSNHKIALFAFNGETYIGAWNGSSYGTSSTAAWKTSIIIPKDNYTFYIVVANADDSDLGGSDYTSAKFVDYNVVTETKLEEYVEQQQYANYTFAKKDWSNQGISFSNGTFTNSQARANRVIDKNIVSEIYCDSNHKIALFAFSGYTYIGAWDGSSYGTSSSRGWKQSIIVPNDNYTFYLVLAKADDSNLSSGDYLSAIFVENKYLKRNEIDFANRFIGKKYAAIGDSITYGFIPRNAPGYPGQLKSFAKLTAEKLGMSFFNYGISGSTVAIVSGASPMCQRYTDLPDDADLITVMGGTNDIRKSVTLGNMDDRTGATFYGALHVLFGGLYKKYFIDQGINVGKTKTIVVCTPIKLLSESASTQGGEGTLYDWDDWIEAVKKVANYYSFPVLDFYNLSNINPHLNETVQGTEQGYTGFYNPYITDGTHPTQEGAEIMADVLMGFLKTIK